MISIPKLKMNTSEPLPKAEPEPEPNLSSGSGDPLHKIIGRQQQLIYFHEWSPGSCFFLPHGTRIYQKLVDLIKDEYWNRGYDEIITPNLGHVDLWKQSGHYDFYRENMYQVASAATNLNDTGEDKEINSESVKCLTCLKPMNCVSGDSLISLTDNTSVPLEKLDIIGNEVLGYDETQNGLVPTQKHMFLDQGIKECVKLLFLDGRELICTPDHKLLTESGWIEAKDLVENESKIRTGVIPPEITAELNSIWSLSFEYSSTVTHKFGFGMATFEELQKSLAFARICGYTVTDGTLGHYSYGFRGQICIRHHVDLLNIIKDIQVVAGHCTYRFDKRSNLWIVVLPSNLACMMGMYFGFGDRMHSDNQFPDFIMDENLPLDFLRQFLSGMFGGDGWAPVLSNKVFTEVYLALSKAEDKLPSLLNYFEDLKTLLNRAGVGGCTITGPYKNVKGTKFHYRIKIPMASINNFTKYIGFAYNCHKAQRLSVVNSYYSLKFKIIDQNTRFVSKCKELYCDPLNPISLPEACQTVAQLFSSEYTFSSKYSYPDLKAVKKSIKNGSTLRNIGGKGFYSPEEYLKETNSLHWFTNKYSVPRNTILPTFSLKLLKKKSVGVKRVYDITVDENIHSFVANGLVVHNCVFGCLVFKSRLRSYQDLPIRYADFGTLHRNEVSGALRGLTRVRRFTQDDAHIFCRLDQISDEISDTLAFLDGVYKKFGLRYQLALSTRPEKYIGSSELWDQMEQQLMDSLQRFCSKQSKEEPSPQRFCSGEPDPEQSESRTRLPKAADALPSLGFSIKEGDGAFYGPKIDIQVFDSNNHEFQCGTIQLDCQLPLRFNLLYQGNPVATPEATNADERGGSGEWHPPIIIHRAILGSLERMFAILTEHYHGKWPFFLSPRQIMIIPVNLTEEVLDYGATILKNLHQAGFYVDFDRSTNPLKKKIAEAESEGFRYNYLLVIGNRDLEGQTVSLRNGRTREQLTLNADALISFFTNQLS